MAQLPALIFAPEGQHDPGGHDQLPLLRDVHHVNAEFSECGRYRRKLERDWTPVGAQRRTILFIGMNPSTAQAEFDDKTCRREQGFARRDGYTRYLKGNVLDFRLTNSKLLRGVAQPVSDRNLPAILEMAAETDVIVLCFGRLPATLRPTVQATVAALQATEKPVKFFGFNQDGSCKHPLYLPADSEILDY